MLVRVPVLMPRAAEAYTPPVAQPRMRRDIARLETRVKNVRLEPGSALSDCLGLLQVI